MSQLLSSTFISSATGKFGDFFDTFSVGRSSYLSIIKEPVKIINNTTNDFIAGYQPENFNTTDVTYQPVTGIFPAVIIYGKNLNLDKFISMKFNIDLNAIYAKVQRECRDFIMNNGKTERVYADAIPYIPQQTPIVQNFLGLRYYYFKLNEVQ